MMNKVFPPIKHIILETLGTIKHPQWDTNPSYGTMQTHTHILIHT